MQTYNDLLCLQLLKCKDHIGFRLLSLQARPSVQNLGISYMVSSSKIADLYFSLSELSPLVDLCSYQRGQSAIL